MRSKGQAAFYALAGGYLLYLAYQLFGGRMDNGGENYWVALIFSIFFVIAGAAILIYTAIMYQKVTKQETQASSKKEEDTGHKLEEQPTETASAQTEEYAEEEEN